MVALLSNLDNQLLILYELQRIDIVKRDTNIRITDMPRKVYRDVVWYRVR